MHNYILFRKYKFYSSRILLDINRLSREHKINLLIPPLPPCCFLLHNRVLGWLDILIILATKEGNHFNQILQFKFSISAYRYEMDSYNLDTHMYLLVSWTNSWLQNKYTELIKHIHAPSTKTFLKCKSCLSYFTIPANLNRILEFTKNRKEWINNIPVFVTHIENHKLTKNVACILICLPASLPSLSCYK